MFMNDLAYVINQSKLSAYTDDTQIFYADLDLLKVQEIINTDLANVDRWYAENGMKRNYTKYQAIVMGKTEIKPEFSCENTIIKNNEVLELLRVTVDEKLKFAMHVNKVCRKVSQQVAVLKRMRNMLPFETRLSIYTPFIAPHFNYCSESWHFCNKSSVDKLEKVNERAIRFVFKDKSTPYEELLNKIGNTLLRHQRDKKIISNVYKLINDSNSPESLKDLLGLRQSSYSLRGKDILKLPKVNSTTYELKSWRYQAAKLWNALPNLVRSAENYNVFKNCINAIDIEHT